MILLYILLLVVLIVLLAAFLCYRMAFYVPENQKFPKEEYPIPDGDIYEPHRDTMVAWIKEARSMPRQTFSISSFDGLKLHGTYYECAPGAPIEIMFHGYRGCAERDMCGGIQRCFALGHNALIVDQRASCNSDGHVITFGIRERRDCLSWVDFAVRHFGPDVKLVLTGISMGASTVLMAGGMELPDNVIGILADCGYTSAKEIIYKVIRQMKLPPKLCYPFVRLGGRLFGGFDLEEEAPINAVTRCKVPVIFYHGEADDFVPCSMSCANFDACTAPKQLVTIPGAGHGLSYIIDPERYLQTLDAFGTQHWS